MSVHLKGKVEEMRTKKTLFALLALGVMSTSAFAEPTIDSIVDKQITVSCDATTGKGVALTVVRKDYPVSQAEWVVAIKEDVAEDGKAFFQFDMPDMVNNGSVDGEYVVYTKEAGKTKEQAGFLYVAPSTRTGIKESLADVTTKDELAAIFNNPENYLGLKFMGYNMDSYNALPSDDPDSDYKSATMQSMFETVGDFGTATDDVMVENFEKALVLNYINAAATSDDCKNVIENFTFENVAYKNIEDSELQNWISLCMYNHKPYESYENILTEYNTSNILYKINNARFSKIKGLLETYATDLDIADDEVYVKYKRKAENGRVNEAIASKLSKTKPQTVAKLMDDIDAAMKALSDKPSSSGSGGTSGNYGGGTTGTPDIVMPVDRNPVEAPIFNDVANSFWGKDAIKTLVDNKIIAGDGNGNFRPNDTITREEFVKMVVCIVGGIDEGATCDFDDVKAGDWCYKYVANAVNKGIIYGVNESNFGKGAGLSRQDMAVICMRVAEAKLTTAREDVVFADEESIADYAKDAVHKLYCAGIVSGTQNNQFSPAAYATRAEAAQILYKTFYN